LQHRAPAARRGELAKVSPRCAIEACILLTLPPMFQVRFHGRGGQGVVTGAELLSVAAFLEGRFAQAFPSFGSERMGAPVVSFCRIDARAIRLREPIVEPDALVIQDATLLHSVEVFQGLRPDGYLLLNSERSLEGCGLDEIVGKLPPGHARAVRASELARQHAGRAVPNAALLGAFAALTGAVTLDAILEAIANRFRGSTREGNLLAARAAYAEVAGSSSC
jgi:pyruvate ferredoxin oxidoreductase gamma subunit